MVMSAVVARLVSECRARLGERHDRAVHEAHEFEHHGHCRAEQASPGCAHGDHVGYEFHSRQAHGQKFRFDLISRSASAGLAGDCRPCNSYANDTRTVAEGFAVMTGNTMMSRAFIALLLWVACDMQAPVSG